MTESFSFHHAAFCVVGLPAVCGTVGLSSAQVVAFNPARWNQPTANDRERLYAEVAQEVSGAGATRQPAATRSSSLSDRPSFTWKSFKAEHTAAISNATPGRGRGRIGRRDRIWTVTTTS